VCAGLARADVSPCPTHPGASDGSLSGRQRGTRSRMRWWQSRDSCDSDAFARPRARRALTGLQGLDVRPCPTPPGPSAGSVAGSCAALVAVCCGRKVALFTLQHGGHVLWSNCNFSVLSGPGVLYHVPIACTNAAGRSEEFFPDWGESSTPDFGLTALGRMSQGAETPAPRAQLSPMEPCHQHASIYICTA
jgi:hypothetical protein